MVLRSLVLENEELIKQANATELGSDLQVYTGSERAPARLRSVVSCRQFLTGVKDGIRIEDFLDVAHSG